MKVLSLFDGMSCGRLALEKLGIEIEQYYASEIEQKAIEVTQRNFPDTIQIGDVEKVRYENGVLHTENGAYDVGQIDLMIGGSPCQDLSKIKTGGKGLDGEKSKLFYEYVRIMREVQPKYFLLENVETDKATLRIMSEVMGVEGIFINSNKFSAQDRPRYYWTNIQLETGIPDNPITFADVMETEVDEKYFIYDRFEKVNGPNKKVYGELDRKYPNGKRKYTDTTSRVYNIHNKIGCLTAVSGGGQHKKVIVDGQVRRLTPLEYERLQTVPDDYTACVSDSARYKMLGNGWTVDVIAHIFSGMLKDVEVHNAPVVFEENGVMYEQLSLL